MAIADENGKVSIIAAEDINRLQLQKNSEISNSKKIQLIIFV